MVFVCLWTLNNTCTHIQRETENRKRKQWKRMVVDSVWITDKREAKRTYYRSNISTSWPKFTTKDNFISANACADCRSTLWISIGYVESVQIFEWIGYRCSNKNYFTLSKSMLFMYFVFCECVHVPLACFHIHSVCLAQLEIGLLFFFSISLLVGLCSFNNLLHKTHELSPPYQWKGITEWFSDFRKCNIEMVFWRFFFVCVITQLPIHWNCGRSSRDSSN